MNLNNLDLIGVSDLNLDIAKSNLSKAGFDNEIKLFKDYKKMLTELNPEIVSIATDSGLIMKSQNMHYYLINM